MDRITDLFGQITRVLLDAVCITGGGYWAGFGALIVLGILYFALPAKQQISAAPPDGFVLDSSASATTKPASYKKAGP
jgi:hypothetical protein